jgi:hypothetical protein
MDCRSVFTALLIAAAASGYAAEKKAPPATGQDDPIGRKLSERIGPYLQADGSVPADARKEGVWKKEYSRLTVDEKVHYCIFQLRNESWSELTVFILYTHKPYSDEPEPTASRELIKLGRHAIPELVRALDSRVATHICPSRHRGKPWLVQDAALDSIEMITCRVFAGGTSVPQFSDIDERNREKVVKKLIDWWEQNKGRDEAEWAKDMLLPGKGVEEGSPWCAINSLYDRLGERSYPFLTKAYYRLPKGREEADLFDQTRGFKKHILYFLSKSPSATEKPVFLSALHDAPLAVRIDGAQGLWAIGDSSGLDAMVKETEERLVKDRRSHWLDSEYTDLVSFLVRCNTPQSREAIYKCLSGKNPYLLEKATDSVPSLHMEKAVRALPELFYDPFIVGDSYTEYIGNVARKVPPRRVCDNAAEIFTKVVPDAPKFDGTTAETQQRSIEKLKQWWKENKEKVKWDEKQGLLLLPKKLKSDPVAAIQSALPKGWAILKVEEDTYPPLRPKGKGKAIFLYSPQQTLGPMQDQSSVVYIMPADYTDGGSDPTQGQAQKYPAALILTTPAAKVYLLGNETPFAATGWPTLKDDILRAIACHSVQGRHAEEMISELNGWPLCALVNASPAMLPPPAHDSALERFTPFLCGSFIRYSMPVLTGAFDVPCYDPETHEGIEVTSIPPGWYNTRYSGFFRILVNLP